MNDFNKFLEIPNKDISQRTHILSEIIEHIKNKDFEKIKIKAHFNGFVGSISDEYSLDLKFLIKEYDDFYNPKPFSQEKNTINNKEKVSENERIFPDDEERKDNKETDNNYLMIIVGIAIAVGAMFFFIFDDTKKIEKKVSVIQKENISEEKEKLIIKTKPPEEIVIKKVKKKEKKKNTFDLTKTKKMYKVKDKMVLIEPFRDNKLWIGIIDLNNKKQVGNILLGQTSYKLKSNTIILTGHGYFDFINNDQNKTIKYRTLKKLFFYYKNGFLYQLKKKDVLALNGGFTW